MAWIELHQTLPNNKKTLRLKALLNITTPHAVGLMCMLWLWAMDNAQDGDLSPFSPGELAEVCGWNLRRAEELQSALVDSGFVDREGDRLSIHHWEDYIGRLLELREKDRVRKRKRKNAPTELQQNSNGTATELQWNSNGTPTEFRRNQTKPDQTQPDQTQPEKISGGGEPRPPAGLSADFLQGRGLLTESYLGVSPALIGELDAIARDMIPRFWGRQPGELDRGKLFQNLCPAGVDPPKISDDLRDLLLYAFEQSVVNGHVGSWSYVEGVMKRLHRRGLKDLRAAEFYDIDREEMI